jgi:hypothetical protein
MPASNAIFDRRMFVLPAALLAVLFGVWGTLRLTTPRADVQLIGLIMFTLVAATFAAIIWGAVSHPNHAHARTWIGAACLVAGLALWLGFLAWDSHVLGGVHVLKLVALVAGWMAACTGVAAVLRNFGPGLAIVIPATLAALFLAFPATVVPLHRALQRPGSTTADRTISALAKGCPTLGALDAIVDAAPYSWSGGGANRVMYGLTTLGQDAPWPQVTWTTEALVYALLAADAAVLALLIPRRQDLPASNAEK